MLALLVTALIFQSSPTEPIPAQGAPLQEAPAFGITLSDDPEPPVIEAIKRPLPNLPAHATADPFAWERSQCSPYIRQSESLEHCQVRVRSDLLAVMGDALPSALRPTSGLENCTPGSAENNFQIQCKPREMNLPSSPNLDDRHCENRPQVQADGRVIIQTQCRTTGTEARPEERRITLHKRD